MMTKQQIHESHHVNNCLEVAANGNSSKPAKNVRAEFKAIARYL
jgi:hypothetical protein